MIKEPIHFDRISLKMFKYYWNQTIFFDLQQGSNILKPFVSYVKSKIEEINLNMIIEFESIEKKVDIDNQINRILSENVHIGFSSWLKNINYIFRRKGILNLS